MKTYFLSKEKYSEIFEVMISNDKKHIKMTPIERRRLRNELYNGFSDKTPEYILPIFQETIKNNQVLKEIGIKKIISDNGEELGLEVNVEGMLNLHTYMISYDYFKQCLRLCEEKKLEIYYGSEGFIVE